jgi:hypothetical protein
MYIDSKKRQRELKVVNNNLSNHHLDTRKLMEKQLVSELKKGLPSSVKLSAYNFSRTANSLYALLSRKKDTGEVEWLTLRLADHPLWLKEAQQLSIDFGNPIDISGLADKVARLFKQPKVEDYFYQFTTLEKAVLQFIDACQREGMVWTLRLPEEHAVAPKERPLDLNSDFTEMPLFLGNRNNPNKLLLSVKAKEFQTELGLLFGRNLLFSQFARGQLLRLLPTNQWIQLIIAEGTTKKSNWKKQISKEYEQELLDVYEKGKVANH